jgi:hypothetical protein
MVKILKTDSTGKQYEYAMKSFARGANTSKKQVALSVGYKPSVANSVVSKIESKQGYKNAVVQLAAKSNNLVIKVMDELNDRGFDKFSNKDLTGALGTLTKSWAQFNAPLLKPDDNAGGNRLRTIFLQKINNQVVNNGGAQKVLTAGAMDEDDQKLAEEIADDIMSEEGGIIGEEDGEMEPVEEDELDEEDF